MEDKKIRLQKLIAGASSLSRRGAEQAIVAGRVSLNGVVVREMGLKADPNTDDVELDGVRLGVSQDKVKRYVALHKPVQALCSKRDDQGAGRRLVTDFLPTEWQDLMYSVGRLDYWSEGLLLMTNDGDFALKVTHPRFRVRKIYRLLIDQEATPASLHQLRTGITSPEGDVLKVEDIEVIRRPHPRDRGGRISSELELILCEGKNREIRRMCECLGWNVLRLKRIQIGEIKLAELKPGRWRALTLLEIQSIIRLNSKKI